MQTNQWSNTTTEPIYTRDAPCSCAGGDCPDCTRWSDLEGDQTYNLLVSANGNCYIRQINNVVVTMPLVVTITAAFCITVQNPLRPAGDVYIWLDTEEIADAHFSIDGVLYDYITVNPGGVVCVCYDGKNFIVTGSASGWQNGPG
jgi:hypothetical protein